MGWQSSGRGNYRAGVSTIGHGLNELEGPPLPAGRVRRKGGGRRALTSHDGTLLDDLRRIVEPATLGSPVRPLLWVSKSYEKLAAALRRMGHKVSATSVKRLLPKLGFSRQSNRKADEGSHHPDRNGQFEHINAKVLAAPAAGQPVISVDTKKKELVGNFKNAGSTTPALDGCGLRDHWLVRPGRPRYPVLVHQAAALLRASFRPRLATTPLRFANPSPPSGWTYTSKLSIMLGTPRKAPRQSTRARRK